MPQMVPQNRPPGPSAAKYVAVDGPPGPSVAAIGSPGPSMAPLVVPLKLSFEMMPHAQ